MPDYIQLSRKIKRGPAIILPKDIAIIIANSNLDKESRVLDAGSGSGILTCFLARFVKRVYSYDNRKEFLNIAKENSKLFGLKNITFRHKDVFMEIKEKNLDLITLDLKEPEKALTNCHKALKPAGYLAVYLPNISQVQDLVKKLDKKFKIIKTIETIERPWLVEEQRLRPEHFILGHTGFIAILRKI